MLPYSMMEGNPSDQGFLVIEAALVARGLGPTTRGTLHHGFTRVSQVGFASYKCPVSQSHE